MSLVSLYDEASLCMTPSGVKDGKLFSEKPTDGDGDFTFSRGSNLAATRVDVNGLIEKGRENVCLYSNAFDNATWATPYADLTSGQLGYDGSNDAWLLDNTGSGGNLNRGQTDTGVLTFSVYAKAGTNDGIRIRFDQTTDSNIYIDLTDGSDAYSPTNVIYYSATSVGNGWYRLSMTFFSSGLSLFRIYPTDNAGNALVGSIYIQDAQLEAGLVATDYIETGASTAQAGILEDMPRLDYSGGASCPALLLEPQRTNQVTNSEYIGGNGWSQLASTTSQNQTTSPEGVDNSAILKPNNGISFSIPASGIFTAGASSYVRTNGLTLTAADYTFSVFVKKVDFDHIQLRSGTDVDLIANATGNLVNLNDGTASVPDSVEDFGNGWYKVSLTFTATASTWYVGLWYWNTTNVTANGSQGVYAYGAQVEAGSYPTSYIPTYGASVTRSNDSCVATSVSDLIGQTQGTIFIDFDFNNYESGYDWFGFTDGTTNNRLILGTTDSSTQGYRLFVASGGTTSIDTRAGDTSAYGQQKVAIRYSNGEYKVFINGVSIIDTTGVSSFAATLDQFRYDDGSSLNFYSPVKQTAIFPTALTDAECIELTINGIKEDLITAYKKRATSLEEGAEDRLDTYLQELEDFRVI